MANLPIPVDRLQEICDEICQSVLADATAYDHVATRSWNEAINQKILSALVESSSKHKFCVNTIIMQQNSPGKEGNEPGAAAGTEHGPEGIPQRPTAGRRGMHHVSGAFWDNQRDGMWNYKYAGAEQKGVDVIIAITWIAL
ncbi:hypothetical protein K470DRAFT_267590 [Piedraia hortae CBS 480.64]|uniref:Tctex-1 n=1 Tax=Piedraia hortae CBS 480.64 TaxID=1314780 RepID=A0A6A7C9N6_9PEZI|nr:hypothetical protein K470DRAFT_267590 [Piedraia hortae CBS 480.64]